MKQFLIILFLIISYNSTAQRYKTFNNNSIQVNRYFRLDTILLDLDTVYVMNSKTFNLYDEVYTNFKIGSHCDNLYKPTITLLNRRISELNLEYELLHVEYDNLYRVTNAQHKKSLILINNLSSNITEMKTINSNLNTEIQKLRNKNKIEKLKIIFVTIPVTASITFLVIYLSMLS